MKPERIAQTAGVLALLVGSYVWWQGRRVGLAVAGLGVSVIALNAMRGPETKKIIPRRKPKPKPDALCSLLAAHRNRSRQAAQKIHDNYTSLKGEGYKSLCVEDADTLIELGYLDNTTAKLNAMAQMPEAAKRHLLKLVLLKANNCVEQVLQVRLDRGEASEDLREALEGYVGRIECAVKQRFALAAMMQRFGCAEEKIANEIDDQINFRDVETHLAEVDPKLITIATAHTRKEEAWGEKLCLACQHTEDGAKLIRAAAEKARPNAEQFVTHLSNHVNFFHTLLYVWGDPLFGEVTAREIVVSVANYGQAIAAGIDGPLAFNATSQTVEQHSAWTAFMLRVAPANYEWCPKADLLALDQFSMHLVPLVRSLRLDDWKDEELEAIAPKLPAVVFFQMYERQQKVVYPKPGDQWVRKRVDEILSEEERKALQAK